MVKELIISLLGAYHYTTFSMASVAIALCSNVGYAVVSKRKGREKQGWNKREGQEAIESYRITAGVAQPLDESRIQQQHSCLTRHPANAKESDTCRRPRTHRNNNIPVHTLFKTERMKKNYFA